MNYTDVLKTLKNGSLFDLYRLNVAIMHELENPQRISELRKQFKEGDSVSYFDSQSNSLIAGKVLQKNPKFVVLQQDKDHQIWHIRYHQLNLQKIDTNINSANTEKLSKNNLKIGDIVGFNNDGRLIVGKILRLNFKTVTLLTSQGGRWRVYYNSLFHCLDADFEKANTEKLISVCQK
jgi:hypothetical protein